MADTRRNGEDRVPEGCAAVQALARQSIITGPGRELPAQAEIHARDCHHCQSEIDELTRCDELFSGTFRSVREGIPDPSPDRVDAILAAGAAVDPSARLLRSVRRTVTRMLLLTLLALSLLPLAALLWWLKQVLGAGRKA